MEAVQLIGHAQRDHAGGSLFVDLFKPFERAVLFAERSVAGISLLTGFLFPIKHADFRPTSTH